MHTHTHTTGPFGGQELSDDMNRACGLVLYNRDSSAASERSCSFRSALGSDQLRKELVLKVLLVLCLHNCHSKSTKAHDEKETS